MEQDDSKKRWGEGVFDLLSWFRMDRVKQSRVLVVGAGALGNEVLKNLALFGIGNIYIVDFDTIEYSNLTRSILFREADADKELYKADIAAKRVREINPEINVHSIVGRLDVNVGLGLYRTMDVVIGCLDSPLARMQLNRVCFRADVPWVEGGIDNLDGIVRVYRKGVNCYECERPKHVKDWISSIYQCGDRARRNIEEKRVPTTPVIASIIGAIQVQEAMKLIHEGLVDPKYFTSLCGKWFCYDGAHMTSRVLESAQWDDDCISHEDWSPVIAVKGLSANMSVKEFLGIIGSYLGCSDVEINMRNTKFVDKLITESDNQLYPCMCPEFMVSDYIDSRYDLYTRLPSDIYQHTYENIDSEFPYQNLTLKQIGIPYWDVIQVSTEKGGYFIELDGDKDYYDN